jgi:hypothetical protein
MKHLVVPLAVLSLALTGPAVRAQQLGRPPASPFGQPVVSPYLNLAHPGVNPAISYFAIVRPLVDTQSNLQTLQQAVTTQTYLENSAVLTQPVLTTGTGAHFLTYNRYFQTAGRPGTGTGAATLTQPGMNYFTQPVNNFGYRLR